jgi:hypothetical protein
MLVVTEFSVPTLVAMGLREIGSMLPCCALCATELI